MLHIVLYQPEIAQNAGNAARTCAVLGATLHLVRPFGFRLLDPAMKRAGMDYLSGVCLVEHASWGHYRASLEPGTRVWATSSAGATVYSHARFSRGDHLLFGPESSGLPPEMLAQYPGLRLPMPGGGRSLNLAVAVGVLAYEAARQVTGDWSAP